MTAERSWEWPLVIFTIGLEVGCGITITTAALDALGSGGTGSVRALGLSILPVTLAAVFASAFHLGRPLGCWRAFINLRQSRLSTEVALTALFGALAFVYTLMWFGGASETRVALGIVTAVAAVLAVVFSSRIYTIPTQPLWNSGWVPSSFLGTTLLLGGLIAIQFIRETGPPLVLLIARGATAGGAVLLSVSALWMHRRLSHIARDRHVNPGDGPLLAATEWVLFLGFVLLAGFLPIAFISTLWAGMGPRSAVPLFLVVLVLGLVGVTLGRMLMYSLGRRLSRF